MNSNPLARAIQIVGSQVALAAALGVRQGHVWKWLNTAVEGVPAKYCPSIERLTQGRVTCEELRSDVDWAYLRGTACLGKESPVPFPSSPLPLCGQGASSALLGCEAALIAVLEKTGAKGAGGDRRKGTSGAD